MCALTALCSVYCVVSTKQTQRLQAGLRLRATEMRQLRRSGKVLIVSTGSGERRKFS